VAEYSVPSYNAVDFALEAYTVPAYSAVDFEFVSGNVSELPLKELGITTYSIGTSYTELNTSNIPLAELTITKNEVSATATDLMVSLLPLSEMTITKYDTTTKISLLEIAQLPSVELTLTPKEIECVIPIPPTKIVFDTTNGWYSFVIRGVEVARLKDNGDLDIAGEITENVTF
jgi:hypothetical protein